MDCKATHLILAAISIVSVSCTKQEADPIPDCKVYLQTPYKDYTRLRNAGSFATYTRDGSTYSANTYLGFGGVLVFRDLEGTIHACDLACPVEANDLTLVDVSMPYAICPECKSKYDLSYGFCAPVSGPSKHSLHIYPHTSDRGTYILVTN